MPGERIMMISKRTVWVALIAALAAPLFVVRARAIRLPVQEQVYPIGALRGTIMRDGTSQPIPGVQVTMVARGPVQPQPPQQPPDPAATEAQRRGRGGARRGAGPAAGTPGLPVTMTATTDGAGQFVFDRVPAGPVSVQAQLQGYFGRGENGNSPTVVSANGTVAEGKMTEMSFVMIPGGTISGRVLNSQGQPMSDTPVSAMRAVYQNGAVTLVPSAQKTTDDRGEYRLYRLPPGEYYVAATPQGIARQGRGAPQTPEAPVTTIYPGALDSNNATLLPLRGGEEYNGIDIQIRTVRLAKISGRVVGPKGSGGNSGVSIVPRGARVMPNAQQGRSAPIREDGSFELPNVLPGSYELVGRMAADVGWGPQYPPEFSRGHFIFGRTPIEVQEADVDGVTVSVNMGFDVRGVIHLDGRPVSPNIRVSLQPESRAFAGDETLLQVLSTISQYQPPIRADGTFSIPMVPEGLYRVQVTLGASPVTVLPAPRGNGGGRRGQAENNAPRGEAPAPDPNVRRPSRENAIAPASPPAFTTLPQNTYVADIRQGSVSLYDNGFNPNATPGVPIEIALGTNPGGIAGTVVGRDQKPFSGATVVLVPPEGRRQNAALYKTARTDADGRFEIRIVPPGPYKLFAWENVAAGAFQNPQFIERFESRGTGIDVMGGGTITVPLEALVD